MGVQITMLATRLDAQVEHNQEKFCAEGVTN